MKYFYQSSQKYSLFCSLKTEIQELETIEIDDDYIFNALIYFEDDFQNSLFESLNRVTNL